MKAILVINVDDCIDLSKYGANIYFSEKRDCYPCRRFVQEYLNVPLKPMPSKKAPVFDPNSASYDEEHEKRIMYEISGWNACVEELEKC